MKQRDYNLSITTSAKETKKNEWMVKPLELNVQLLYSAVHLFYSSTY